MNKPVLKRGDLQMEDYDYKPVLGAHLKEARTQRGLTQEEFAEMLDITQKHYSEVERGINGLSIKHLLMLSNILNVSIDFLIKDNFDEDHSFLKYMNEVPPSFIDMYISSSKFTQERMLAVIKAMYDIEQAASGKNESMKPLKKYKKPI